MLTLKLQKFFKGGVKETQILTLNTLNNDIKTTQAIVVGLRQWEHVESMKPKTAKNAKIHMF